MSADMTIENALTIDRRAADRRGKPDRRQKAESVAQDRRAAPERRQKVERRRQIDPTTCERDYTDAEIEFMTAMDRYRRVSGRPFPTWSEVLEVVRSLGYQKVEKSADSPAMITGV
jgi:hypothetical protein